MTINLTPAILNQIYMDKKDGYLINMVDKLTPEIDYTKEEDTTQKEEEKTSYEKKESFFKESEFGFTSYMTKKSLNNSFSTQGFFDTLRSSSGNVNQAS